MMSLDAGAEWTAMPTETEIYILPNGEIIVADLPAELAAKLAQLTSQLTRVNPILEANTPASDSDHVSNQQHPTHPTQFG